MDFTSTSAILAWLIAHGYYLMFLGMCIEGPIITAVSAFAVAHGHFNLGIVFVLSILGDVIPDTIYYYIGYGARIGLIEKYGHYFGFSPTRVKKVENFVHKNSTRAIITLKFTPLAALPGFMIIGSSRVPYLKYIFLCTVVSLFKTSLFMLIGYYSGVLNNVDSYVKSGNLVLVITVAVVIAFYFAYKKFSSWLSKQVDKDNSL